MDILREAQKLIASPESPYSKMELERVYVVFDKDDLSIDELNKAMLEANRLGYKIGFSNEAFELWLLLHFNIVNRRMTRVNLKNELSKIIGRKYTKADDRFLRKVADNIETAFENSVFMTEDVLFDKNPYTNIGHIIKEVYISSN
ncbi:MAG: RloB family protein [Streptococcaceae bacterium]|nr:RloB family protein [Streptococcaceae bacterium]